MLQRVGEESYVVQLATYAKALTLQSAGRNEGSRTFKVCIGIRVLRLGLGLQFLGWLVKPSLGFRV